MNKKIIIIEQNLQIQYTLASSLTKYFGPKNLIITNDYNDISNLVSAISPSYILINSNYITAGQYNNLEIIRHSAMNGRLIIYYTPESEIHEKEMNKKFKNICTSGSCTLMTLQHLMDNAKTMFNEHQTITEGAAYI